MDYVVGSVAALISGNVTPNRPRLLRKALTPTKHQPSPNVTPKSEQDVDRSIFLSPSLQKKKAIVKKSPKRIFQNPDMDVTSETEKNASLSSPKANKVKKHLQEDLEGDESFNKSSNKSPKKKQNDSEVSSFNTSDSIGVMTTQNENESTPKKKNKRKSMNNDEKPEPVGDSQYEISPIKKNKQESKNSVPIEQEDQSVSEKSPKKKKKSITPNPDEPNTNKIEIPTEKTEIGSPKKRKKNKKKKSNQESNEDQEKMTEKEVVSKKDKKKKKKANFVNPNAITTKDSDSEHESDDEILSENEEANKEILDTGPVEESSDEEAETKLKKTEDEDKEFNERTEEEIKRTLFVGNVPFNNKCKKEVKRIFSKYGDIETVRIRTVPVKDARVTPKLAVIRNELHPERSTVNVYVKFKDAASVEQALVENNTVLNGCHLRVTRSCHSGAEHDPRLAVFVGNVPFALEDDALRQKFEQCGEIESVRIVRDKKTNAGKGFAYVNFASKDGVELALAMSDEDLTIKNRILRVKRCSQLTNKKKGQSGERSNFPTKHQGGTKGQFARKGGFNPRAQNQEGQGAFRRILNKRQHTDGGEGPPNKRQKPIYQPHKEKKVRKEFVGMTAEKKKKHTFNKGQKKKKALSEILTK